MRLMAILAAVGLALPTLALAGFEFTSIDGGVIRLDDWKGKPVLVVNTASLCGYAGQFNELQALHDRYGPQGLLVLAVPSDDFNQELGDEAAVKEYCDLTYDLTLPMTTISHVKGKDALPFYAWVKSESGFVPGWNFNKVLLGGDGQIVGTWGAPVAPDSAVILAPIEALLP